MREKVRESAGDSKRESKRQQARGNRMKERGGQFNGTRYVCMHAGVRACMYAT